MKKVLIFSLMLIIAASGLMAQQGKDKVKDQTRDNEKPIVVVDAQRNQWMHENLNLSDEQKPRVSDINQRFDAQAQSIAASTADNKDLRKKLHENEKARNTEFRATLSGAQYGSYMSNFRGNKGEDKDDDTELDDAAKGKDKAKEKQAKKDKKKAEKKAKNKK